MLSNLFKLDIQLYKKYHPLFLKDRIAIVFFLNNFKENPEFTDKNNYELLNAYRVGERSILELFYEINKKIGDSFPSLKDKYFFKGLLKELEKKCQILELH